MKKQLFFVVVSGFMIYSDMFCTDPKKQIDLSEQANAEISPEQMMRVTFDLTAYKNIMQAGKDAQECTAYKKSLEQFSASYKNLVQIYTSEVSGRLNEEEKTVLTDILDNVKEMTNLFKVALPQINDGTIDQATKEQRAIELNNRLLEQYEQLMIKVAPFGLVAQQQKINPEEVAKNLDEVITEVISFLDSLSLTIKQTK